MIKLKRAYDPVSKADGRRFLVERLWPRGLTKAKLHVDGWLKDVGPSCPSPKHDRVLRGAPLIPVMEAADLGDGDDVPDFRWLK